MQIDLLTLFNCSSAVRITRIRSSLMNIDSIFFSILLTNNSTVLRMKLVQLMNDLYAWYSEDAKAPTASSTPGLVNIPSYIWYIQ